MDVVPVFHLHSFDFCAVCIYKMLHALHIGELPILHVNSQKVPAALSMLMHCRTAEGDPLAVDIMVFPDGSGACGSTNQQCSSAVRRLLQFESRVWRNVIDDHDLWTFVWPCHPNSPPGDNESPLTRACGRWGCLCKSHIDAWLQVNYGVVNVPQFPCKPRNRQRIVS